MNLAQVFFLDHPKSLGEIRSSETRLGVAICWEIPDVSTDHSRFELV